MVDFARLSWELHWKRERQKLPAPERFRRFVLAREMARHHKELVGGEPPHNADPIIARNRFCNVNREDDAVTRYLKPLREAWAKMDDDKLVPQLLAARIWNHPPTLERIMPIVDIFQTQRTLRAMREAGEKTMRGAYMMPVHGGKGKGCSADDYYLEAVGRAATMTWNDLVTLEQVANQLMNLRGIGEFLANQVCADLRYTDPWRTVPDWHTFVLCGPGTRRGLDRYAMQGKPKPEMLGNRSQSFYVPRLLEIKATLMEERFPLAPVFSDPNNLANCFCEWDKHERVLQDETARLHSYP